MAENVVDELLIEIRMKTEAFERGLAEMDRRLQESESKAKKTGRGLDDMGKSGEQAGKRTAQGADEAGRKLDENKQKAGENAAAYGALGAAGAAAFWQIVTAVSAGIDKANEYTAAINGLRNQVQGVGASMADTMSHMSNLTADALISEGDTAAAIKNLLNYGFTINQAAEAIDRLKDSAAYGRQANYSLGEAVRVTTEGIRMENSVLSDAAGVQKNIAKMIEDYAKAQGKSKDALTQSEKAQAVYNGIMAETEIVVGNAAAYSNEFAGAQQRLAKAAADTERAIGSAASNALEPFYNLLTPVVQGIADFAEEHEGFVAALGGSVVAFTGVIGLIALYKTALSLATAANISFQASLGWIGLITVGIGAVAGLAAAIGGAKQELEALSDSAETIASYQTETRSLRENLAVLQNARSTTDDLTAAKKALAEQFPDLIAYFDDEGNAVLKSNEAMQSKIDATNELIEREKELMLLTSESVMEQAATDKAEAVKLRDEALANQEAARRELEIINKARKELRETGADEVYTEDDRTLRLGDILFMEAEALEARQHWGEVAKQQNEAVAAADAKTAQLRAMQYDQEIGAIESLSAAQALVAEQAKQEALEKGMQQQEFAVLLNERIHNEERLAQADADLAAQATQNALATNKWADSEKALKTAQDANNKAANAAQVKKYADTVKASVAELRDGKKATDDQKNALAALAQHFGISEDAIMDNITGLSSWADQQHGAAQDLRAGMIAEIQAFIAELSLTEEAAKEAYPHIAAVMAMLSGDPADAAAGSSSGKRSGSGGSSQRKKAWELELEMMERVREEAEEMGNVYVLVLQDMLAQHGLSAKERQRLEKELAMAQKEINGELEQEYTAYLQNILARQKLSAEERLAVEKKLISAQKDLQRQQIEDLDALGNAVVDALRSRYEAEQAAQTESITQQTKNAQDAAKAQTDAINKARDDEVKRLTQARDEQIKLIEEIRDAKVKAAEDERDAVVDGIEAQIRAIDDYIKARDRSEKDDQDEKKLAQYKAMLAFEKDQRNQQILNEQIIQLEKDIAKRKEDERLADEKASLQEQLKTVKDSASDEIKTIKDKAAEQLQIAKDTAAQAIEQAKESAAQQLEIIQAQLDAEIANLQRRQQENDAYWQKRLANETLQGEALVLLNNGTQEEILQLLKEYNPEYLKAGNEMGQMLYSGFDSKYKDLLARTDQVSRDIISKAQSAIAAWQRMQAMVGGGGSGSGGTYSSPAASLQTFAQQLIDLPQTLDNALTATLYRMTEAPRTYYATRAAEAGLDNYAIADFANGNLNAVTAAGVARRNAAAQVSAPTQPEDFFKQTAANMPTIHIENNYYTETATPYQVQSATRRGIEAALRQRTRG